MPLYLEQFERDYLLHVLEGKVYTGDKPIFLAKKQIISKVVSDNKRIEKIGECTHEFAEYIGHKQCCKKCGGYDQGMGEEWEVQDGQ